MKGNQKLIGVLNDLLTDELTAISQYMVQSEMCDHWGYHKLHESIEKHAKEEMHHAEWLIQRVLFLEGHPVVTKVNPIKIGKTPQDFVTNDHESEETAIRAYNKAIALAGEGSDQATADLLTQILKMEEGHIAWAETQAAQIKQIGLENYLANQV